MTQFGHVQINLKDNLQQTIEQGRGPITSNKRKIGRINLKDNLQHTIQQDKVPIRPMSNKRK